MNPFRTGKLVMFQVSYDRDWHFFEYLFVLVIGLFGVSLNAIEEINVGYLKLTKI